MAAGQTQKSETTSDPEKLPMIGRYELIEQVGKGGLGEVFKARNSKSGHIVALKRLHDKFQKNSKILGLFHKEIMIHSRVVHRHCVRFIEADLTPPNAHIVTNFIEGYNCHHLMRGWGPIPPLVACAIVLDMLQGLEHLHCLDIVHSDITPANVMVNTHGLVLLADFGLSCISEVEDYAGMNVGTPGYQAPERLQHAPITTAADIYAAGIILYELLKGERLFGGLNPKECLKKMKKIEVNWVKTGNKDIDQKIKSILISALNFKPSKRFDTPRDFMYALYSCLKWAGIRYTRRAILQWMWDQKLTKVTPSPPPQKIYI